MKNLQKTLGLVILLLIIINSNAQEPPITDGLVGYWSFCGQASDVTKFGEINPSTDRFENPSNCFQFDGIDDYIKINAQDDFSFCNANVDLPFSISVWLNISGSNDFTIISKANDQATREWELRVYGSKLTLFLNNNGDDHNGFIGRRCSESMSSYLGQWIHIVATYNGNGTNVGIKLYIKVSHTYNA